MKTFFIAAIAFCLFALTCRAQWTPASADIYFTGGKVGIGAASPAYTLHVTGNSLVTGTAYLSNGDETHYAKSYSVPAATNVTINLTGETATLATGHQYRIMLNTAGTGTNTGAVYIVYQAAASTWVAQLVSANGTASNHPLLDISGSSVYIYQSHTLTYTIHTEVLGFYNHNSTTAPTFFGLEGAMTNLAGNIGIGTIHPDQKLTVNGQVHSTSVLIDVNVPVPDYVFKKDYSLRPLADVKTYVEKNHHLPEVPSAAELKKDGMNVGDMNLALLKKVEELTLYVIELNKTVKDQQKEIEKLKK